MSNNSQTETFEDDQINLIELATTLGEEKKILFGLPFIVGIISIVVSLMMTPIYTAKVTLLPPSSSGGLGAMLGDASGLAALAGLSIGRNNNSQTYISILQSRSAAEMANERFNLMEHYDINSKDKLPTKLKKIVQIQIDKKSEVISIEANDKDPVFAANLANGFYEILLELQNRLAITQAQRQRVFFEDQFAKAKEKLTEAELNLARVQRETGVLEIESQASSTMSAIANIRAQIAGKEVKLASFRSFATNSNPGYQQTLAELAGLREQLRKLETQTPKSENESIQFGNLSASQLPETALEYVRAFREVKYQQAIFEVMAKQFEFSKLEEAKEGASVQLLDAAVPPELKSKPKRVQIVVLSTLAAGFLAVLVALIRGALRKNNVKTESRAKLTALKNAWKFI
jgi:tyrosine-protein kinase Etk/Wzc